MYGYCFISGNTAADYAYADFEEEVYLGGYPIGIKAKSDNPIVAEYVDVITNNGSYSPAQKAGVQKGDIILSANKQKITSPNELAALVKASENITLEIRRKNEVLSISIIPETDIVRKEKKLGISVRNDLSGIGTMTFVAQDGTFGALGHRICDNYGYHDLYKNGEIFPCVIYGYKRATNGEAGELCGKIDARKGSKGQYFQNNISGISGKINENEYLTDKIKIGHRNTVVPGKACIYTTIDGTKPKLYEIEIIRTVYQKNEKEKGMLIRVTDQKLLQTTGGILQGMSGSPIIQNNKLVGAVTHVLTNDSTMGYGIYIDWMRNYDRI